MGKCLKELNLTPVQIKRLQQLRAVSGSKTRNRRQALRDYHPTLDRRMKQRHRNRGKLK